MGVIGSAKLLQALARDHLVPGLKLFSQGTQKGDEPIYAILITFLIAQVTMFADINQIASFITMTVSCSFLYSEYQGNIAVCRASPEWFQTTHVSHTVTGLSQQ